MPELPEVETVRQALVPVMDGAICTKALFRRPDLRFPLPADLASLLKGATIHWVRRRAKILLIAFDHHVMLLHLGMSGSVRISAHQPNSQPHDHVELQLEKNGQTAFVTYNDPRRFGYIDLIEAHHWQTHPSVASLGPEPVMVENNAVGGGLLTLTHLNDILSGASQPIKSFLLDQRKIAGLGNIYVCEALFRAGISPRRKAATVKGKRAERLLPAIQAVLTDAIAQGGTSLRDHRQPDGKLGYFVQSLQVYGKEGDACDACQTPVRVIRQSGRSSFYCPTCQR